MARAFVYLPRNTLQASVSANVTRALSSLPRLPPQKPLPSSPHYSIASALSPTRTGSLAIHPCNHSVPPSICSNLPCTYRYTYSLAKTDSFEHKNLHARKAVRHAGTAATDGQSTRQIFGLPLGCALNQSQMPEPSHRCRPSIRQVPDLAAKRKHVKHGARLDWPILCKSSPGPRANPAEESRAAVASRLATRLSRNRRDFDRGSE